MAFVTGTATFTNGSATLTGVTLSSGQLSYIASGTAVFVEAGSSPQVVEAISGSGGQITLRLPWSGVTGSYSFVAFDTIEGLRDAVQSARGFSDQLQTVLNNISVNPAADSFVQRTSGGQVRGADAVNSDELVALGQLGTAATRNVGTGSEQVPEYTAGGLSDYGYGGAQSVGINDFNGFGYGRFFVSELISGSTNTPPIIGARVSGISSGSSNYGLQIVVSPNGQGMAFRGVQGGVWQPWAEVWHNGNLPDYRGYGLGVIAPVVSDLNASTLGQGFYTNGENSADSPNGRTWGAIINLKTRDETTQKNAATLFVRTFNDVPEMYVRAYTGSGVGSLGSWYQFAISGLSQSVSFGAITATSLNVSGSKNFRIVNPVNDQEYLYHSAIESDKPRTQYIHHVTVDDTLEATVTLPDWFHGLNGNTCTVFVSPCEHFGAGYGKVVDGVLTLTTNAAGEYHVLIMAERSDQNVADWVLTAPIPQEEEVHPTEPQEDTIE